MFVLLALALAFYVFHAAAIGEVWVRQGMRARLVTREESPVHFWTCIAIYAALALAMGLWF